MAKKDKCPFCGSEERMIKTPYVSLNGKGEYETKMQPCCRWQGQNMKWVNKHENPITHERPDLKEVAKW